MSGPWWASEGAKAVIAAPFIGSFLGLLVVRLPARRPVIAGRSHCDRCGHALAARDLLPVLSFALLGGRCRHCGAAIGFLHPGMEIGALVVALWAAGVSDGWWLWASCAFGWCLLTLAVIDLRDGVLPDVLTLPLLLAGLSAAALESVPSLVDHACGAAAGFAVFAGVRLLYRRLRGREGLGMGDVKLAAASGALVSWQGLPSLVLIAAGCTLLAVLAAALVRNDPVRAAHAVPFGPGICLASWLVWLYGPIA